MSIDLIDWNKLKPSEGKTWKSFEELCFQIAGLLHGKEGRLTRVDDSGGGSGVEFFQYRHDGQVWGWQAKFHSDGRLTANRKADIQNSLNRSCMAHKRLSKWFLCTRFDFTEKERMWFEGKSKHKLTIPKEHSVSLEHWGNAELLSFLSRPDAKGKLHFFFGSLELSPSWFRNQFSVQCVGLRDKYDPSLHTATEADSSLHQMLGDQTSAEEYNGLLSKAASTVSIFENSCALATKSSAPPKGGRRSEGEDQISKLAERVRTAYDQFSHAGKALAIGDYASIRSKDYFTSSKLVQDQAESYFSYFTSVTMQQPTTTAASESSSDFEDPFRTLYDVTGDVISALSLCLRSLNGVFEVECHLVGSAGAGKTHLACYLCDTRLKADLPVLLIPAVKIRRDSSLRSQLLEVLDLQWCTWNEFISVLSSAALAYRTRVPLILEGLNESVVDGGLSPVWRQELRGLVEELRTIPDVVLITTCRESYIDSIWSGTYPTNAIHVEGFAPTNVHEAVSKYFRAYKIRASISGVSLEHFRHPLFLRLFCETQNPGRQRRIQVYVGDHTLFSVFDQFLSQCERRIGKLAGLRPGVAFLQAGLLRVAEHLWEANRRSIPVSAMAEIFDGRPLTELKWEGSSTQSLESEGLLIARDSYEGKEYLCFTYDLLGGYLIARHLILAYGDAIGAFLNRAEVQQTLFARRPNHPLAHDILRSLSALLAERGSYLHDLVCGDNALRYSITAFFEIDPKHVTEGVKAFIAQLFASDSRRRMRILDLAHATLTIRRHPLNISFFAPQLAALSMAERDLSWTEHVRSRKKYYEALADHMHSEMNGDAIDDELSDHFTALASVLMWVLTSTDRNLRDKATRSLYYYGRQQPKAFGRLLEESISINDIYIPERMYSAAYGIAMARAQGDGKKDFDEHLVRWAKDTCKWLSGPNAGFITTHILLRDCARGIVELAGRRRLLSFKEMRRAKSSPPRKRAFTWGQEDEREAKRHELGPGPMNMDFENYTLGRLVRSRGNYDFGNKEYVKIKRQILWRIYNLGYSRSAFGRIDRMIAEMSFDDERTGNGKTDRYGKKYCWIAFFELAGYRADRGLIESEAESRQRISDVDLDPSFPEDGKTDQVKLADVNLLGSSGETFKKWICAKEAPDLESLHVLPEVCGAQGPWVLLDGFHGMASKTMNRRAYVFLRGLLVRRRDCRELVGRLKKGVFLRGEIPEVEQDYYTFAGEAPLSRAYPRNKWQRIQFQVGAKRVIRKPTVFERLNMGGARYGSVELSDLCESASKAHERGKAKAEGAKQFPDTGLIKAKVPILKAMSVLLPLRILSWESYHSSVNPGIYWKVLSKNICVDAGLHGKPQSLALVDKDGKIASTHCRWERDWANSQHFVYVRKDVLDYYLSKNELSLVWAHSGERVVYERDRMKEGSRKSIKTPLQMSFRKVCVYR